LLYLCFSLKSLELKNDMLKLIIVNGKIKLVCPLCKGLMEKEEYAAYGCCKSCEVKDHEKDQGNIDNCTLDNNHDKKEASHLHVCNRCQRVYMRFIGCSKEETCQNKRCKSNKLICKSGYVPKSFK